MKEVYELDVYRLAEELSDMIWDHFDRWPYKAQTTIGYQPIQAADGAYSLFPSFKFPISSFQFQISSDVAKVTSRAGGKT